MIWHKIHAKTEGKSCSQKQFFWWQCKNSMQRTERKIFLKTVLSDDDAQNSGKAGGQISLKKQTESLHKTAFSSSLILHFSRHTFFSILEKVWRQRPSLIAPWRHQNYSSILIYIAYSFISSSCYPSTSLKASYNIFLTHIIFFTLT